MLALLLALGAAAAPQDDPRAEDCQRNRGWIPLAEVPLVVRQGDAVPVAYSRTHGPDGRYAFSPKCLKKWKISDPRVKMSRDRMTVIVPADLPAGTVVEIEAAYDDSRTLGFGFTVLGREEATLAGRWSETGRENCEGRRVAELVMSASGAYSFTIPEHMVETMVTGSGRYRWDAATGAIDMGGLLQGKAVREGRTLVMEGINLTGFQNGADMPVCRVTFAGG